MPRARVVIATREECNALPSYTDYDTCIRSDPPKITSY